MNILERAVFLVAVALAIASGCKTVEQYNPYGPAETLPQYAFATYGVAVLYMELGARMAADSDTPDEVVFVIRDSARTLHPLMETLVAAAKTYDAVRLAPDTTPQQVDAAFRALNTALTDIRAPLYTFMNMIMSARSSEGTP